MFFKKNDQEEAKKASAAKAGGVTRAAGKMEKTLAKSKVLPKAKGFKT